MSNILVRPFRLHKDLKDGKSLQDISDDHFGCFLRYHSGIRQYMLLHMEPQSRKPHVRLYYGGTGTGKSSAARYEAGAGAY